MHHVVMQFFKRNTDFWYNGYLFQGIVILGLLPILLPLFTSQVFNADKVGAIVAAVYAGQLSAPLIGTLADRYGLHGSLFLSGFVAIGIGYIGFLLHTNFVLWLCMALLIGIGSSATNTIGGMYIVERYPQREWDRRIGWMQTYYGLGQSLGVCAMIFLQQIPAISMAIAAALMLPGMLLALFRRPKLNRTHGKVPKQGHTIARGQLSATEHYHRASLKSWLRTWQSPFSLFIFAWFFLMLGTWMIYNLYPLLMQRAFGMSPALSSLYFTIGAAVGVIAYPLSGTLGEKVGNKPVLLSGFVTTLIAVLLLAWFAYFPSFVAPYGASTGVILITIAWSPLIVGATATAAALTPVEQGEALGILNASTAIASIIAGLLAGQLAHNIDYAAVALFAAIAVLLGHILIIWIPRSDRFR